MNAYRLIAIDVYHKERANHWPDAMNDYRQIIKGMVSQRKWESSVELSLDRDRHVTRRLTRWPRPEHGFTKLRVILMRGQMKFTPQ